LIYTKNESIYKLIVADDFANKVEIGGNYFVNWESSQKNLYTLGNDESLSRVSLIRIYQPKLEVNIKRICDSLKKSKSRAQNNLDSGVQCQCIRGDINIMDICGMDDLINKFYFLSRDGAFPSRSNNGQINVNNYKFEALNSLKTLPKLLQQILEAVKRI
jgi:hypothetical protein